MKIFKIALIILALCSIGWVSYTYFMQKPEPPKIAVAPNKFIPEIKQNIEKLGKASKNDFCVNNYTTIINDIIIYAKAGKIDAAWSENLFKELDYCYYPLFLRQALYVLEGSEWESEKLGIIRSEYSNLIKSKYITDRAKLNEIKSIIDQYDEIVSYISSASIYANSSVYISSIGQKYDFNRDISLIDMANSYKLDGYIGNCSRIKSQLSDIHASLYNRHLSFLSKKVSFCLGKYKTMKDHSEYFAKIYQPLFEEFQSFQDNYSIYSVSYTKAGDDLALVKSQLKKDGQLEKSFNYPSINK